MPITTASSADIPVLVQLMNAAYRGDLSKQGWSSEADLIKGEHRTDDKVLEKLFETPGSAFLKYENDEGLIEGCVYLQKKENKLYLGMLTVSPLAQAKGIGRQLMAMSAIHAKENGCHAIFMNVISIRHELVAWYERQGYCKTGTTLPFTVDPRFGMPTQPLEFVVMEKEV